MITLEAEILELLENVSELETSLHSIESKLKKLRIDIESQLNAKEEVVDDNDRRKDG